MIAARTTASSRAISRPRIKGGQGAGPTGLAYFVRSSMLPGGLPADDSGPYIPAIRGMAIERPCNGEERYLIVAFTVMTDVPEVVGP